MKILHVGQMIGGLGIYIKNSIKYSVRNNQYVIVKGKEDKSNDNFSGHNVRFYSVNLYRKLNPIMDLICIFQVLKLVWREKPDIIHCHSAKGGVVGRIAGFLSGVPTIYTPHAFSFLSTTSVIKYKVFLFVERALRLNSYVFACSESERQLAMQLVKYDEAHALVWNNSVPDSMTLLQADKEYSTKNYVCYVGRPCFQKNTFFLIDIVKQVLQVDPSFKLCLLGVGYHSPDLVELKRLIDINNLGENIKLVPWLSQVESFEYIAQALFYVSVSRYEGLPLSVIESMALAKPIIASDVIGNKDCVTDGENGFLLPLDKKIFADKILTLLKNDSLRNQMGQASRRLFQDEFNIEKQILKLQEMYEMVATHN